MSDVLISSEVACGPCDTETMKPDRVHLPMTVRSFGMTDTGKVRTTNEDQLLIAVLIKSLEIQQTTLPQRQVQQGNDRGYLFVVADGVGGSVGGEHASALAIDSVETFMLETFKWFFQLQSKDEHSVLAEFHRALRQANACVLAEAEEHPELHGMCTTLTLAYTLNDTLFLAHVGDSRCYLGHDGYLSRLTSDHTLVAEMVRAGTLQAEEVAGHRWRHVVTNVVGGEVKEVKVEVHQVQLVDGDRLLLCTDGLTEMLTDKDIAQIIHSEAEPEQACRRLVQRANAAGGRDNITVIVAHFQAGH